MGGKSVSRTKRNAEEFVSKIPDHIVLLTEYESGKKPITVYCKKCGRTHTYSEARYVFLRKCHGCWLNEIREKTIEDLLTVLKACNMSLVNWPQDSKRAIIRCNVCGSEFDRTADDVIRRKKTVCLECKKSQEIKKPKIKKNHKKAKYGSDKWDEMLFDQRKSRMLKSLSSYEKEFDILFVADDWKYADIRHRNCGREFRKTESELQRGYGCVVCSRCGTSKGVQEIEFFLKSNGVQFEREKRFDDCRRKNPLPFDFFVPSSNLLIEYNGEQHYRATEHFGGEKKLELYRERDRIKRQFAREHGYRLLVIPWYKDPVQMLRDEINRE